MPIPSYFLWRRIFPKITAECYEHLMLMLIQHESSEKALILADVRKLFTVRNEMPCAHSERDKS